MTESRYWRLIDDHGRKYLSDVPGALGGHKGGKLYGRLDCSAALSAIARGGYVKHRVFFRDEATAISAGYRPCAVCMPREYVQWKYRANVRRSVSKLRSGARNTPGIIFHDAR